MFLTDKVTLDFDGLEFLVKVPDNEELTRIYLKSQEIFKKADITPTDIAAMADEVTPLLEEVPEQWHNVPRITADRLLFEIGKYMLNECLSVPELKKK